MEAIEIKQKLDLKDASESALADASKTFAKVISKSAKTNPNPSSKKQHTAAKFSNTVLANILARPAKGPTFRIIVPKLDSGLGVDAKICAKYIKKCGNFIAYIVESKVVSQKEKAKKVTVNVFIQNIPLAPDDAGYPAEHNWWVPNQEFIEQWDVDALRSRINKILCKSLYTFRLFERAIEKNKWQVSPVLTKFTSQDYGMSEEVIEIGSKFAVHMAGSSFLKGTLQLLKVWTKYFTDAKIELLVVRRRALPYGNEDLDYWKTLDVQPISTFRGVPMHGEKYANIVLVSRLEDNDKQQLFSEADMFINPSIAEGFGHIINEGRSMGKPVVTIDAPPMNAMVTPDSGFLIAPGIIKSNKELMPWKKYLGFEVPIIYPDELSMKKVLQKAINTPKETLQEMGKKARDAYLKDKSFFETVLCKMVADVTVEEKATQNTIFRPIEQLVSEVIGKYHIKNIYDIACSDMTWKEKVLSTHNQVKFRGADISPETIDVIQRKKSLEKCDFLVANIVQTPISAYDMVIAIDAFDKLSASNIQSALSNISNSGSKYLLTTAYFDDSEKFPPPVVSFVLNAKEKRLCLWKLPLPEIGDAESAHQHIKIVTQEQVFQCGEEERKSALFSQKIVSTLWKYLTKNATMLDVGAGVGLIAIPMSKKLTQVVVYEALQTAQEFLIANIKANKCQNIEVKQNVEIIEADIIRVNLCSLTVSMENVVQKTIQKYTPIVMLHTPCVKTPSTYIAVLCEQLNYKAIIEITPCDYVLLPPNFQAYHLDDKYRNKNVKRFNGDMFRDISIEKFEVYKNYP